MVPYIQTLHYAALNINDCIQIRFRAISDKILNSFAIGREDPGCGRPLIAVNIVCINRIEASRIVMCIAGFTTKAAVEHLLVGYEQL